MKTPVLFIIFNRPDATRQAFEAIREAKPPRLYIAADGPRKGKEGESEKCQEARTIALKADWPCVVKTLFQEDNLGCKYGVSCAIDWFFKNEEAGIILEDDCVASQDFFRFCEEMLEKYKSHDKVMQIAGSNFQFGKKRGNGSYYFSQALSVWGWATWRSAWMKYDKEIKDFEAFIQHPQRDGFFSNKYLENHLLRHMQGVFKYKFYHLLFYAKGYNVML